MAGKGTESAPRSMDLSGAIAELDKFGRQLEAFGVIKGALAQVASFDQAVKEAQARTEAAKAATQAEETRLAQLVAEGEQAKARAQAAVEQAQEQAKQALANARAKGRTLEAKQAEKAAEAQSALDAVAATHAQLIADNKALAAELAATEEKLTSVKAKIAKLLE